MQMTAENSSNRAAVAGYSGKPAADKLGYEDGQHIAFIALPAALAHLATARASVRCDQHAGPALGEGAGSPDIIHYFTRSASELIAALPVLEQRIARHGMIWVSWPKKASKVPTDVTEDVIRNQALTGDLVDVKVCAVDPVWSGLKLVIRKDRR